MFKLALRRTMRPYCGHGCASRSAGEVRASAPTRALVAAIAALLAVLLVPTIAFADSSIIWGPSAIPNAENGIVVNAPDRYRAAAVALGYGDDAYSNWSDDVKAKLSNASTGGRFYEFAQLFGEVDDAVGADNPLTAVVSAVGNSFWAIAETLYGDDIWLAGYSSELAAGAASDLSSVLAGENIGGGGSGGGSGGTGGSGVVYTLGWTNSGVTITWSNRYQSYSTNIAGTDYYPNAVNYGSYQYARSVTDIKLRFTDADVLAKLAEPNMRLYVFGTAGNSKPVIRVLITNDVLDMTQVQDSYNGQEWTTDRYVLTRKSGFEYYYKAQYNLLDSYDSEGVYNCDMSLDTFSAENYTWNIPGGNGTNVFYYAGSASGGPSEPVVPPTNWPEEPSAPSPPELPEPGTNPTVTPTPWVPIISPSFDFDLNVTTDPISSDLIDWVQKIYYELKAFHSDAHDWLIDIGRGFDGVVQAINHADHQIYSQLLVIDDTLRDEGLKIRNYMYQMFHWLAQQFDFQNDSFNDSNIVYWLKRIWSKLGNGDINLRPTDPTTEPDDWFDWLVKAIQNFLVGLAATSSELISEIADLASQVMHEFPFSIPWDIAAILGALATSPITPSFTITIPAIDGWWDAIDFVIDLKPFDSAAATIRLMEKLLFTGFLIWKSKDLLEFMDVTKWFN